MCSTRYITNKMVYFPAYILQSLLMLATPTPGVQEVSGKTDRSANLFCCAVAVYLLQNLEEYFNHFRQSMIRPCATINITYGTTTIMSPKHAQFICFWPRPSGCREMESTAVEISEECKIDTSYLCTAGHLLYWYNSFLGQCARN